VKIPVKIPVIEFLPLNWIYRSISINMVCSKITVTLKIMYPSHAWIWWSQRVKLIIWN